MSIGQSGNPAGGFSDNGNGSGEILRELDLNGESVDLFVRGGITNEQAPLHSDNPTLDRKV